MAFLLPHEEKPHSATTLSRLRADTAAMVSAHLQHAGERGVDRDSAQRFILQAVMAMFAEDIGLLPHHVIHEAVSDVVEVLAARTTCSSASSAR